MADQSPVQSVERTFSVIELLCKNGESGITELSAASGLNKTTVFRLLSTLVSLGYAAKIRYRKYRLTLKFLKLSAGTLSKARYTPLRKAAFRRAFGSYGRDRTPC